MSVGNRVDIQSNPLKVVDELDKLILADDSKEMWIQLSESLKVKDLVIGKLVEFCNYFVKCFVLITLFVSFHFLPSYGYFQIIMLLTI